MSFLGKEYVYDSNDGVEAFMTSVGRTLPEELKQFKVRVKTTKEGDTYTVHTTRPDGVKKTAFKSGVEFDDEAMGKPCKTTITVDGNTMTSVRKFEKGNFVLVGEYTDDKMVTTMSIEGAPSKATITFKAA